MNTSQRKFKKVIKRRIKAKNHAKKYVEKKNAIIRKRSRMLKAHRDSLI